MAGDANDSPLRPGGWLMIDLRALEESNPEGFLEAVKQLVYAAVNTVHAAAVRAGGLDKTAACSCELCRAVIGQRQALQPFLDAGQMMRPVGGVH